MPASGSRGPDSPALCCQLDLPCLSLIAAVAERGERPTFVCERRVFCAKRYE